MGFWRPKLKFAGFGQVKVQIDALILKSELRLQSLDAFTNSFELFLRDRDFGWEKSALTHFTEYELLCVTSSDAEVYIIRKKRHL